MNTQHNTAQVTRLQLAVEGLDSASLGLSCVQDLGTMMCAIKDASEKGSAANRLAMIGEYLAETWANMLIDEEAKLERLRESELQAFDGLTHGV